MDHLDAQLVKFIGAAGVAILGFVLYKLWDLGNRVSDLHLELARLHTKLQENIHKDIGMITQQIEVIRNRLTRVEAKINGSWPPREGL